MSGFGSIFIPLGRRMKKKQKSFASVWKEGENRVVFLSFSGVGKGRKAKHNLETMITGL